MTFDGLYGYTYDVVNRLVKVTYGNGNDGVVAGSDAGGITGIEAGNRHEHYYYDVLRGVPERAVVTDGRTAEQDTLAQNLQAEKIYVIDRSYQAYQL